MREIAEQIADIVRKEAGVFPQSDLCVVGRPVSFSSEPQLEVSYALGSGPNEVFFGIATVKYKKPLLGKAKVTALEPEISLKERGETNRASFGLDEMLPSIEADSERIDLMDQHEPWLYRVVGGRASFAESSERSFACWFEKAVKEKIEGVQ